MCAAYLMHLGHCAKYSQYHQPKSTGISVLINQTLVLFSSPYEQQTNEQRRSLLQNKS